jgi:hypothetical protein
MNKLYFALVLHYISFLSLLNFFNVIKFTDNNIYFVRSHLEHIFFIYKACISALPVLEARDHFKLDLYLF